MRHAEAILAKLADGPATSAVVGRLIGEHTSHATTYLQRMVAQHLVEVDRTVKPMVYRLAAAVPIVEEAKRQPNSVFALGGGK